MTELITAILLWLAVGAVVAVYLSPTTDDLKGTDIGGRERAVLLIFSCVCWPLMLMIDAQVRRDMRQMERDREDEP